jgi:hypothetical protein
MPRRAGLDLAGSSIVILTESGEDDLAQFLFGKVGRSTLILESPISDQLATAFLFNDLLSSNDDTETYVTWVITADAMTYEDVGGIRIRHDMASIGASANNILMTEFPQHWYHFPDIGVAGMPMAELEEVATRKGWSWLTQPVTDGLAATAADIEALGTDKHTLVALGHPVEDGYRRPLRAGVVRAERRDTGLTCVRPFDAPFVGGPAFVLLPIPDSPDPNAQYVKCAGVILPGEPTTIATFDRIRGPLRRIITEDLPPGTYPAV